MVFRGDRAAKHPIAVTEKEYFKSGAWKCEKSPTGGHWWNCNIEPSVCKICGKVKGIAGEELVPPQPADPDLQDR
jgi:hypothetical protein